jgi:hypothetical protein
VVGRVLLGELLVQEVKAGCEEGDGQKVDYYLFDAHFKYSRVGPISKRWRVAVAKNGGPGNNFMVLVLNAKR